MTLLPTPFNPSVRLPTGELDENRAIDCVAVLISRVRPGLEKGCGREWLKTALVEGLREGQLVPAIYAVRMAETADDEICDAALRIVFAEMVGGMFPPEQRGPGHLQVWAYGQHAVLRTRPKRSRGRRRHNNLVHDIHLCLLIKLICGVLGVQATRNPAARRAPSAISLVVAALARLKIEHLNEESVQQHIWFGPTGDCVRAIIPALIFERTCSHLRQEFLSGV